MRKSFVKSLLEFQERVLYYGDPRHNKIDPLFFNRIFMSNTDEMFEKYDMTSVLDEYGFYLGKCYRNIFEILKRRKINLVRYQTFEERFAISRAINDKLITIPMNVDLKFQQDTIYYLGVRNDGSLTCSYIDPRMAIYGETISCVTEEGLVYWKTDNSIADYIASTGYKSVIPVKVVYNRDDGTMTKVAYNGDVSALKPFTPFIPKSAILINNPYLYTDDIVQMVNEPVEDEQQKYKQIEALDLIECDELIEYPNDSFNDYLWFLRSAIANPETREIYLTLYRIGSDPTIYYLIRRAVAQGIKVCVNIELFATGEEEINSLWARELEQAGAQVVSFAAGKLKVHSKITLVKFNNGRSIVQIGTGNYHTKTTMQYTDLSLMTGDEDICHQAEKLFKLLTENHRVSFSNDLLVTLFNARDQLIKLIDKEAHKGGYICLKCNSLDDDKLIEHLWPPPLLTPPK